MGKYTHKFSGDFKELNNTATLTNEQTSVLVITICKTSLNALMLMVLMAVQLIKVECFHICAISWDRRTRC